MQAIAEDKNAEETSSIPSTAMTGEDTPLKGAKVEGSILGA